MIVKKHLYQTFSCNFDIFHFYNLFKEKYNEVSYFNPCIDSYQADPRDFKNKSAYKALNGVHVKDFLSFDIIDTFDDVNDPVHLDIELTLFTERIALYVLTLTFKDNHKDILSKINNFENNIKILNNGKIENINIGEQCTKDLVFNLIFQMTNPDKNINNIIGEFDPYDIYYNSQDNVMEKIENKLGVDVDIYGPTFSGVSSSGGRFEVVNIYDDDNYFNTSDLNIISNKYDIFYDKEKKYIVTNDENVYSEHLKEFSKYRIYWLIVESYNNALTTNWFSSLEHITNDIIKNLNNKNEIYWNKLRNEVEKSQLTFLYSITRFRKVLKQISPLGKQHIYNKEFRDNFTSVIKKKISSIKEDVNEIKYGLDNIATPGHTHDEQLLQKVTEKGNERILLLSFLAMSIPMIGAILSPSLTFDIKLISGGILISLPLIYALFVRFRIKRKEKRNMHKFLNEAYTALKTDLNKMNKQKQNIIDDKEQKNQLYLQSIEDNINLVTRMMTKLKKRMK